MNYSDAQRQIINSSAKNIVVVSAAASGKTACLAARTARLLNEGAAPEKMALMTFTNMAAEEMSQRIGKHDGMYIGTIHGYANQLLLRYGIDTSDLLVSENFDDLFELALDNPQCAKELDYLLIDEAQDLTELEYQFIFDVLKPKSFFAVGDHKQCQPEGTKIYLRNNIIKNIEDIQVGDSILYYEPKKGRCCGPTSKGENAIIKKVEKIERHTTEEPIITITTASGKKSHYTPGHRTYVQLHNNGSKYCVYLMCDNNYRFRIGKISLGTDGSNKILSWRTKMRDEGCEKIWLLKIFDSDHEARVEEAKISYTYGIPQSCWQIKKVSWTKEDIDYIYKDIPIKERCEQCLKAYNQDIRYPFFDITIDWMKNNHFAGNGSVLIYANNIIPQYMSALCYDFSKNNHSNKGYELIIDKNYLLDKETTVYSLQVEGGNYVADGIVTHNSIYQFRGSRPDLFLSLCDREDTVTFNLKENYRNAKEILYFAKGIINKIGYKFVDESIPISNIDGKVIEREFDISSIISLIHNSVTRGYSQYKDWFILCRFNETLNLVYQTLQKNGFPIETFKRSGMSNAEMEISLNNNTIKVLTIHAAKGLEADNVIVLGAKFYSDEERRISYVAATRAKKKLFWYNIKPKKKKKDMSWE